MSGRHPGALAPAPVIAPPPIPIHGRPADVESLRDLRGPKPLRLHCTYLGGVYRGRTPPIDARGLGLGGALKLALAAEVRFELGEHAAHVEEALACRRAGVDRLFGSLQGSAAGSPMLRASLSMRVTLFLFCLLRRPCLAGCGVPRKGIIVPVRPAEAGSAFASLPGSVRRTYRRR
jgi:hypothetical protein